MRNTSIASILPLLMLGNSNQDLDTISILIAKYGRVKYLDSESEVQKIKAGAVVHNEGKLKLGPDASALVFSNGNYVRLDETGEHELSAIFPEGSMQKLNFDARFNQYLMAALDLVLNAGDGDAWGRLSGSKGSGDAWGKLSDSKGPGDGWGKLSDSKKTGDAWGRLSDSKGPADGWGKLSDSKGPADGWGKLSDSKGPADGWGKLSDSKGPADGWGKGKLSGSKGSGDAWGDEENRIVPILPFGKLEMQPVIFQWSQPQISQSYSLEIMDEDGGIVYSGEVKDNWTQMNMSSLPLKSGNTYSWRINVPEHPDKVSTKARIMITDEDPTELLKKKLKKSDAYQLNDLVLSGLMEAIVLEEAAFFYEAHQRYEMLRQSFKKNNLVKLMMAAFYMRHQLKPRAEQLFRRKSRKK